MDGLEIFTVRVSGNLLVLQHVWHLNVFIIQMCDILWSNDLWLSGAHDLGIQQETIIGLIRALARGPSLVWETPDT